MCGRRWRICVIWRIFRALRLVATSYAAAIRHCTAQGAGPCQAPVQPPGLLYASEEVGPDVVIVS